MNFQNMLRNNPNQNMFLNPTPAAGPNRYVEPTGQIAWVQPNQAVVEMYRTAIGNHLVREWEREQMALPDEDVEVVL